MSSKVSLLQKLSSKIFGTGLPGGQYRSPSKLLRVPLSGFQIMRYYPEDIGKVARTYFPGYTTEEEGRRLKKLEALRRKGKGPPTKGAGKRAAAGKKK